MMTALLLASMTAVSAQDKGSTSSEAKPAAIFAQPKEETKPGPDMDAMLGIKGEGEIHDKLVSINQTFTNEMATLNEAKGKLSDQDYRDRVIELQKQRDAAFEEILTPEQMMKLNNIREELGDRDASPGMKK
ncbi:MAG: hypothetical protein H6590_03960 [Flavobacteriales bacterium]|nr:hypothetical protein [Flavobacteriales bacterium]MCB9178564.1 hypothetical protein [Flavobacteriales bacterium]